ncbi:MAG: hypothetical protein ACREL5_03700 [Gemmatimonadales bacterium]
MTEPDPPGRGTRFLLRAEAGAVGGLVGAVAVALLFFFERAIHLHPLAVPTALASGFLGGASGASSGSGMLGGVSSDLVIILEMLVYTVVHLLTFAAVGFSAVFVVDGSRFWTSLWGGAAYAGVTCTALLYLVRWIAGTPVALDVVGLPRVLLANVLAGAIIGVALYTAEHSGERSTAT